MYGNEDTSQEEAPNSTSTPGNGVSAVPAAATQSFPAGQTLHIQYQPQPGTSREETHMIQLPHNNVGVKLPGRKHVQLAESESILLSNTHLVETLVPAADNGHVEMAPCDAVVSTELQQASSTENVSGAVAVERSLFSTRSTISGDPESPMPPSPIMETTVDNSGVAVNQFVDFATPILASNHKKNAMLEQQTGLTAAGVKTSEPESWQNFDAASQTALTTGQDVPHQCEEEEKAPGRPCTRSSRKREAVTNLMLSMPSVEELEKQVNTTNTNKAVFKSTGLAVKSSSSSSVCDHTVSESSSFSSTCSSNTASSTSCTCSASGTSVADSPPHQHSLVHTHILPNAITTTF